MHHPEVKHTLDIFERICNTIPPLVPQVVVDDLHHALEHMQNSQNLSIEELEETMVELGKRVWPYNRAFKEFFDLYEGKLGEKFLLGKLDPSLKKRYKEFKEYGGTFRDLHSGSPAEFFTVEERQMLCTAFVDVSQDLTVHVKQHLCGNERESYEKRIVEFQMILDDMEKRLNTLRDMADNEQKHPELASEIREQVRVFEHGMCLLHQSPSHEAVCNSLDHFQGRKQEVYKKK